MFQNVRVFVSFMDRGKTVVYLPQPDRHLWIQAVEGEFSANGQSMKAGDGASTSGTEPIELTANINSQFLLFDLA